MDTSAAPPHRLRIGIALAAGVCAIAAMAVMFTFDYQLKSKGAWLPYLLAAPIYILLQVFAEGALAALWSSKRWLVRAIPVVVLLGYYVLWFAFTS